MSGLIGTRVRFRWPDGGFSDSCGVITHVSPCKRHPEWWPLGDFCGYLPAVLAGASRDEQRAQFAADARMPEAVGCQVRWDAVVTDGGPVMLPVDRWRDGWVTDSRWLATGDGEPLEVPPLIERVPAAGGVL